MDSGDWLVTATLVTSSVVALTANLLLLLVFCRRRGLRTVSNRFVINLLLTNLLSSLLLIPFLLVDRSLSTPDISSSPSTFIITENVSQTITSDSLLDDSNIEEDLTIESTNYILKIQEEIDRDDVTVDFLTVNITQNIHGHNLNRVLCFLAEGGTSLVCAASILSILLIGVDQYFAVIHSLRYHACIDKWTSMFMIVSAWIIAIIFGILGATAQTESKLWKFCRTNRNTRNITQFISEDDAAYRIYTTGYVFCYALFIILAPFVLICVIYVCIYKAAHRSSARMRRSTSGNSNTNLECYTPVLVETSKPGDCLNFKIDVEGAKLPKASSAPNIGALENDAEMAVPTPPSTVIIQQTQAHSKVSRTSSDRSNNSFINSLRYKLSNASNAVFKYREETRAAKISILVIFMVLICYVPYGLALILNTDVVGIETPEMFNALSLQLLVISNIISPFLFAYRNRRVQKEICRLFGLIPKNGKRQSLRALRNRNLSLRRNTATVLSPLTPSIEANEHLADAHGGVLEPLGSRNVIPEVVVTCKVENEVSNVASKKSILKRVCSKSKTWTNKKCNFITVPDSCLSADCRGSFSSASTQVSSTEE